MAGRQAASHPSFFRQLYENGCDRQNGDAAPVAKLSAGRTLRQLYDGGGDRQTRGAYRSDTVARQVGAIRARGSFTIGGPVHRTVQA
jgi:hypothetical protein